MRLDDEEFKKAVQGLTRQEVNEALLKWRATANRYKTEAYERGRLAEENLLRAEEQLLAALERLASVLNDAKYADATKAPQQWLEEFLTMRPREQDEFLRVLTVRVLLRYGPRFLFEKLSVVPEGAGPDRYALALRHGCIGTESVTKILEDDGDSG